MQGQRIVVIHPGSQNLRVGLASDANPITILHAVARRKLVDDNCPYRDAFLPPVVADAGNKEFDAIRLQVTQALPMYVPGLVEKPGRSGKRAANNSKQTVHRQSEPQEILVVDKEEPNSEDDDEVKSEKRIKLEEDGPKEILFDEDILKLDSETYSGKYNVHFPMRRGELNLHRGIGGSLQSVLFDLEQIWLYALHERMGIDKDNLPQYLAVLVIPDIYNRSHLRELVTLLLQRMQFRACFLLQDHVASTFGAGLSAACIVDVGHEKTSISCVEDGISHPDTRVRLSYGGGDVSQVFFKLLRQYCSFPYKECDVNARIADALLIARLKEENCHISDEMCGPREKTFDVKRNGKLLRYSIRFGDECVVAPLSLLHTELLNITGKPKEARVQLTSSQQPDAEDCFDADYISETSRRNGVRDNLLLDGSSIATLCPNGDNGEDELVVDDVSERDSYSTKMETKEEVSFVPNGQILPLDQAIVRCIDRCPSDDMKRKMYGNILLVGGCVKLPGFAKCLEKQVAQLISASRANDSLLQPFEVHVCTKEMDARNIPWKGAAIMSCLESAPELWIQRGEWEKGGLRILREKALFSW